MDTHTLIFDDQFTHVGGLGYFQYLQFAILGMIGVFGPEPVYVNFIAAELPHWCHISALENYTFSMQRDIAIPYDGKWA